MMRPEKLPNETAPEYQIRAAESMRLSKPEELLEEYSSARFDCIREGIFYASLNDRRPRAGAEFVNGWYSTVSDSGHKFPERRKDFIKRIAGMWWMYERHMEKNATNAREVTERAYWECRGIETGPAFAPSSYW